MRNKDRTEPVRRVRGALVRSALLALVLATAHIFLLSAAIAHEGHDHDKPAPLNLPIAPRVVAVTPDYELVGVLSGEQRLTIFLHHFATGEPVKNAQISVSGGEAEIEAVAKEDGIFELTAAWLRSTEPLDLIFKLTLPDDQDILTGRLEKASIGNAVQGQAPANNLLSLQSLMLGVGALMAGVLLTLLVSASLTRRRASGDEAGPDQEPAQQTVDAARKVKQLRRVPVVVVTLLLAALSQPRQVAAQTIILPSVPATMATDVPQRMADGSLFVPKATQHLLAIRTAVTAESQAPRTVQLIGTLIADPNSFGRVQAARPGRIEAPEGGLPYVGKRVEKGELLGYLVPYIEAADKANIESQIAEAEARIAKLSTILSRYTARPGSVPQVKVDEVEGEIEALRRKRAELQPSLVVREAIRAPLTGVVSVANLAPGQIIESREVVFEIVDPARFWVEAIAHDPSVVANLSKAFALLNNGERMPLEFGGVGLTLKQQATPITFKVSQAHPNLSIGRPVTVVLQSTAELSGIVLPAASVVRSPSGLAMVWIKTEPERFEPQTVRTESLDGQRVVVTAGLKSDIRVVTEGATLLNQIR